MPEFTSTLTDSLLPAARFLRTHKSKVERVCGLMIGLALTGLSAHVFCCGRQCALCNMHSALVISEENQQAFTKSTSIARGLCMHSIE